MKLIVGLGNPGKEYEFTRHNAGFLLIDKLTQEFQLVLNKEKFHARFGEKNIQTTKVIFMKPLTFMNLSGEAVVAVKKFYKLNARDILVIHDDLDLDFGKVRFREKGSSAGHNGIESLIKHLGTNDFARVKIGIGRPENKNQVTDYVLKNFTKKELKLIEEPLQKGIELTKKWLTIGRSTNV